MRRGELGASPLQISVMQAEASSGARWRAAWPPFSFAAPAGAHEPSGSIMSPVATAAYLRVSTGKQDWKLQRDAIARACKARGDRIPKRLWFEEKRSGRSIERPALQKLRAAVQAGEVGRLYIFRVDRLGRSGIRDTLQVVHELKHAGCVLVSVADGFPLDGPASDIVIAVMAWAAQIEREAIGARIKAARVRVEAKGGRWGRPRRIDPGTLARARALQRRKIPIREIAVRLKVPRSTLADALAGKGHYAAA